MYQNRPIPEIIPRCLNNAKPESRSSLCFSALDFHGGNQDLKCTYRTGLNVIKLN